MAEDLKPVGYWASMEGEGDLPWPGAAANFPMNPRFKARLIAYLNSGTVHKSYRGMSTCRLCGRLNGSQDLTDGTWVWPSGLSHYVKEHDVLLNREFLDDIGRKL